MDKLPRGAKDIFNSRKLKRYNRRELLLHLVEVEEKLSDIKDGMSSQTVYVSFYKENPRDPWISFETTRPTGYYPIINAFYQHYLARAKYIRRRLEYVLY